MANCADLVAAVSAINETLVDIRDNYLKVHDSVDNQDLSLAGLLLRIDRSLRYKFTNPDNNIDEVHTLVREVTNIQKHLGQRLTSRTFQRDVDAKLLRALEYLADSISERLAQSTQQQYGAADVPESNMVELVPLDVTLDADSEGLI